MLDLFTAAPQDLRDHQLRAYTDYLETRDGDIDMQAWTLSKREQAIARHEAPPSRTREMDRGEFNQHYVSFDRRNPPSEEMTLLLALVKVNAAEAYGVTRAFQRTLTRALNNGDDAELRILCEEGYHTRILLSSAKLYGIEVNEPYRPPSALRILIGSIATLPDALARPLTLAGEIIATLMFVKLLQRAREVLRHAPEVRDSVEERLLEIATDERGHVSYNRLHMGPAGLAQTRVILPMVTRVMATALPEVVAAGGYPHDIFTDLPLIADPKRMPEAMRQQCFAA